VWEIARARESAQIAAPEGALFYSLGFGPQALLLAAASEDGTLRVYTFNREEREDNGSPED